MTKNRLILLIAIFIALVIAGVSLYYFFFAPQAPITIEEEGEVVVIPPTADGELQRLSDSPAVSPSINEEKNTIKYLAKDTGKMWQSALDGSDKKEIPFVSLKGLVKTFWSEDQEKFINIYVSALGTQRFYYELPRKIEPLNSSIKWLDYSKTENKIAYHYEDIAQNVNVIAIANPDGSSSQSVINTRLKDAQLKWITKDNIAVSTAPSGLAQNILYNLNVPKRQLTRVLSGIFGLTSLWSPDGSGFVFSQTDEKGYNLRLSSAKSNGSAIQQTDIKTLPEKCVFSQDNENIYCAEPRIIPEDAIMPDDYYKKTFSSNDALWKVNINTGRRDFLYEFQENIDFDLNNLTLAKDEKYLYFINRNDGLLYRLEL